VQLPYQICTTWGTVHCAEASRPPDRDSARLPEQRSKCQSHQDVAAIACPVEVPRLGQAGAL